MREITIPSLGGSVRRVPGTTHLVPRRGATWDGWFAIAIFPAGSPLRWAKGHFFRGGGPGGWRPLSAVESLVESEVMLAWASGDEVETASRKVDAGPLEASTDPLGVSLPGRFSLSGSRPRYNMSFSLPESGSGASFDFQTAWPVWWARQGRFLSYVGQHSNVRLTLWRGEGEATHAGFGVIEHVSGTSLAFGLLLAIATAIAGPYRWAVRVRTKVGGLFAGWRERRKGGEEAPGPLSAFVGEHAWALRIAGFVLAFLLLLLLPTSVVAVIVIAVLLLVYLALVEILR